MELDDRASIRTPEGVELDLTLAGLGSRFGAALLDSLILGVLLILTLFGITSVVALAPEGSGPLVLGVGALVTFVLLIGYFLAFELGNGGRTPGKAAFGLRVVAASGEPVGLWASLVRNLLRVVDFLPAFYALGAVSILASGHNQRLGDLAGRTLVVRDERQAARRAQASASLRLPDLGSLGERWDVSAVGEDEFTLIRRFMERSRSLPADRRSQLAASIATRIRPRVSGVERELGDEEFLARVLAEKLNRGER